jgi:hypothetical protein
MRIVFDVLKAPVKLCLLSLGQGEVPSLGGMLSQRSSAS